MWIGKEFLQIKVLPTKNVEDTLKKCVHLCTEPAESWRRWRDHAESPVESCWIYLCRSNVAGRHEKVSCLRSILFQFQVQEFDILKPESVLWNNNWRMECNVIHECHTALRHKHSQIYSSSNLCHLQWQSTAAPFAAHSQKTLWHDFTSGTSGVFARIGHSALGPSENTNCIYIYIYVYIYDISNSRSNRM